LSLALSQTINGIITILQKLRPKDATTDLLFVGTDRFHYFTLAWNPQTSQFDTLNPLNDPGESHMRESQSQDRALVDPSGRYLVMHLWEGVLTILGLGTRKPTIMELRCLDQIRVAELFIKHSTFLYTETGRPQIAFLYQERADSSTVRLATYYLVKEDKPMEAERFDASRDRQLDIDIPDPGASILIPVRKVEDEVKRHNVRHVESAKAHLGGLIVVGETQLLYIDEVTHSTVQSALTEASIFVAWAEYNVTHYFLADDYGGLHLLTLNTEGVVVKGMDVNLIGRTSRASNLVYLGTDLLFASHYGDSQLFRLDLANEDPRQYLQLVQTMSNIGPILDFAIMDLGNRGDEGQLANEYSSGQARIVTCSGAHKDGTLRSVRSGVGLEDVGILADLEHCRGLFPLRSAGSGKTDTLVVSFLTETRVFRFDSEGEVEEVEAFAGMALNQQTLLVMNVMGGQILQVTASGVTLLDPESGIAMTSWAPGAKSIVSASANQDWLLVSVEGTELVSLSITSDLRVVGHRDISKQDQVACIHVPPQLSGVAVVGFWTSGTISIIDLTTLEPIHGESLRKSEDDASIPRDLALVQILPPASSGPTLFIAMQDGDVVTFNINPKDMSFSGRKRVMLGMRQARLHLLPQPDNTTYNIFATTEHPSLIYGAEGRTVYSAVTADEATYVCPFDTHAFPGCIAVATETQLRIALIDRERRTHVKPLVMGEMVRRIAYSPREKVFGLGCVKRELQAGEELVQSSFKLVDEVLFDRVGRTFLLGGPGYTELVECVVRAELRDSYGNLAERFLVGTSFLPDPDYAPAPGEMDTRGRLLVFGVDAERNPYLILDHKLKGACRCLATMEDTNPSGERMEGDGITTATTTDADTGPLIVVGLTKTVVVCKYTETSSTSASLDRLVSYRPSSYPAEIIVRGRTIVVADLMKSLALVEFVPGSTSEAGTSPPKLVERARHPASVWATAVAHVEGDSWLEADAQGNLLVLRRNLEGVTTEDRTRMEVTSEINLGEMVNRIREIEVETTPGAVVVPRAFLGTVSPSLFRSMKSTCIYGLLTFFPSAG
jgi:DNA damage-binding protein 1